MRQDYLPSDFGVGLDSILSGWMSGGTEPTLALHFISTRRPETLGTLTLALLGWDFAWLRAMQGQLQLIVAPPTP
jgi:hypothetical protein